MSSICDVFCKSCFSFSKQALDTLNIHIPNHWALGVFICFLSVWWRGCCHSDRRKITYAVAYLGCSTSRLLNRLPKWCLSPLFNLPERSAFSGSERLSSTVNQKGDDFWSTCTGNLWLCLKNSACDFSWETGWVSINQPALNGMASERGIWCKERVLCCGIKLSSNPVLSLHTSARTRSSGMSLVALPARCAGVSRSRVSLRRGSRMKSLAWSTPVIFQLCQERQRFSQYWPGKRAE